MSSRTIFAGVGIAGAAAAVLAACMAKGDHESGAAASQTEAAPAAGAVPLRDKDSEKSGDLRRSAVAEAQASGMLALKAANAPATPAPAKPAPPGAKTPEGPTRAWFPETFLFEPLVVTDDHGAATVPVRVPDRLTTWRVLALAHARTGAQGGAVASFLGTLPTYVDPVVPPFLVRGDEVRIPIQLVNTTAGAVASTLEVSVTGATLGRGAGGARTVPARGSLLDHATVFADHAGRAVLRVALGGTDAVERSIEVRPAGRPVAEIHSGTLAAPRRFHTAGTPGADPATDRVRLQVFPGALALLRSELAVSAGRGEATAATTSDAAGDAAGAAADHAYALLLAGKAPGLLAALGDTPDPAALRELAIIAGQRAIRDARELDVDRAALLAEPAAAHPENPVLARIGLRAAAYLAHAQRPDGTFSGATGWTLQRVLVATAEATRAVGSGQATLADRQRALQVSSRAAGAFARTADQVGDGYTAAAILASGAVAGDLARTLRDRVRGAIKAGDDGARYLEVGAGVVRADGTVPSRIEATALAVLALDGDAAAPLVDLGTTLLGGYSVARGWGDGRTNLAAMRAVLALFRTPLPRAVTVTLAMDGAPIVRGTLEGARLRDVLALDGAAPGLAGPHEFTLVAEPAVPGLGYSLELDSWLAWDRPAAGTGLELALPPRVEAVVGRPVAIAITAVAPAGIALHIRQALPAGVQVDTASLEAQVSGGALERFTASDGAVDLYVPALAPGATFALEYRAIATLAGTLHTGPSRIEAGTAGFDVAPAVWTIR